MERVESQQPLVSVILPAFNAAPFIGDALRSVLAQTYQNIEVLVVDDGSTDATADIVRRFAAQDMRVVLIRQDNGGVAAARNTALGRSNGEFIAPIDADDIWFPEKIEKQVHAILPARADVGVVYAWTVRIDRDGNPVGRDPAYDFRGDVHALLMCHNFCCASAPLIRRQCFTVVGGYDAALRNLGGEGCEDLDLLLRIAERYQFDLVPEYLVGYRRIAGTMSSNVASMERSFLLVMKKARKRQKNLSRTILSWSHSNFYIYLVRNCNQKGDYRGVLHYLGIAAGWELHRLLFPETYRQLFARHIAGGNADRSFTRAGHAAGYCSPEMGHGWACADRAQTRMREWFGRWHLRLLDRRLAHLKTISLQTGLLGSETQNNRDAQTEGRGSTAGR